jgi:putative ABC transport system permease protein
MNGIAGETRYALRTLFRSRGYTAVAILTLALSMGAGTAIFSMADAIVNRPFAFPQLPRVMDVATTIPRSGSARYHVSPADYTDWVARNRVFAHLAAYKYWDARMTGGREPERVRAALVSPGFFPAIGIAPLEGRAFGAAIGEDERYHVVVSYGFWRQRLSSDPAAVGRSIQLNGLTYTIAGVMPQKFDYPSFTELWAPWIATPREAHAERAAGTLSVIGRLAPGISPRRARVEMASLAEDLARQYPATDAGRGIDVMPLSQSADPYAGRYVTVVAAAVVFLLILACANVANLQLVRCSVRRPELALRAALGAGRGRIARQVLLEGMALSLAGAALGLPLAFEYLALIKKSIPPLVLRHLPGLPYAALDSRMLLWTLVAALAVGIAFTLPAMLQVSTRRLIEGFKDAGRGAMGATGRRMRSILVVCEIAFALVLLSGAGSIFLTVQNLAPTRQGFNPANVYTFGMRAPEFQYAGDREVANLYRETLRRLAALPEVSTVAAISELPALADSRPGSVVIEGRPAPPPEKPLLAEVRIATPDYFRTFRIPIAAGRALEAHDDETSVPVAVVSREAARRFWPRQDAIGRRLRIDAAGLRAEWLTVAGVAGDVNHFFLDSEIRPVVYVCYLQYPVRALNVVLRPAAGLERTGSAVRAAVASVDRGQPVYAFASVSRSFSEMAGGVGVIAALIGTFALLALVLCAAGVYAVMHYSVAQRTREIGVRMAMGARPWAIASMVIGDALRMAAIAVSLALPATWAAGHLLAKLMAGIAGSGSAIVVGAAVVVGASAALAGYFPARRASRIDPLEAIRHE